MPAPCTPARATSGHVCMVLMGWARATTKPVARPKAIWETMNQNQFTRAFRSGLITPSVAHRKPVHKSGATRPPHSVWRLGNIGRMTA